MTRKLISPSGLSRLTVLGILILSFVAGAQAQTYKDSIIEFRKQYIRELLAETNGPVKSSQAKNFSFFPTDRSYCVWADFKETPGTLPFMVPTHSGKSRPYKEYGTLTFYIHDTMQVLHVYQSMELLKDAKYKSYLFLPFRDMTNYEATYGGGRYIDLMLDDVKSGRVLLDFNKAYNPYCAYTDGYSCPIPPDENRLHIEITVGEKTFIQ